MNPVGSFSESVSVRATKSSTVADGANSGIAVTEVNANGERAGDFAQLLEPTPGDAPPASTDVAELAEPVAGKSADGWTIKSLASLMSFIGEPLAEVVVPDEPSTQDEPNDAAAEMGDSSVDPMVPLPPPVQAEAGEANIDASAEDQQPQVADAGAAPQPVVIPPEAAAARNQGSAQQVVHATASSVGQSTTTQAPQPRRAKPAEGDDGQAPSSTAANSAVAKSDGSEAAAVVPPGRSPAPAQREIGSKEARQQPNLSGEGVTQGKHEAASMPRTEFASGMMPSSGSTSDAADDEDAFKSANVKSVSQETHFMLPSHRTDPARQIADVVVAEVAQTAPVESPETARPNDQIVKVLDIHLEPRELGAVHVRMAISNGALTLEVKVETEELASRLQREGDTLTKMLQSSGVTLDNLVVQSVGVDRAASSGNDPSLNQKDQGAAGYQANANSADTNEGRSRGDDGSQGGRREGDRTDRFEPVSAQSRSNARAPGAIYI